MDCFAGGWNCSASLGLENSRLAAYEVKQFSAKNRKKQKKTTSPNQPRMSDCIVMVPSGVRLDLSITLKIRSVVLRSSCLQGFAELFWGCCTCVPPKTTAFFCLHINIRRRCLQPTGPPSPVSSVLTRCANSCGVQMSLCRSFLRQPSNARSIYWRLIPARSAAQHELDHRSVAPPERVRLKKEILSDAPKAQSR